MLRKDDIAFSPCFFIVQKQGQYTEPAALRVFAIKALPKVFGLVCVGDNFRIQSNGELYELLNDMDIKQRHYI